MIFSFNVAAELTVHFIDLGQGDAILLQHQEGDTVLIDGGDRFASVEEKLISYLNEAGVDRFDAIIATHPHADHIGGLSAVIEKFPVDAIYDSGRVHTSQTYEDYLLLIDEKDLTFKTPRRGDKIELDNLTFDIIHPGEDTEKYSLNDSSIVTYLQYDQISFIFTGDIEEFAEREILGTGIDISSTILKVAHHGSRTSTNNYFLEAVNPEIAVIQVGEDNRFNHPAPEVINLLEKNDIEIYRNDLDGDIIVNTDGEYYSIETNRLNQDDLDQAEESEISEPEDSETNYSQININQASKSQLESLWGVGPVTADNIIEYREDNDEFQTIEEIKEVDGIDSNKFNRWKDQITI
nr:MBL fold metallo-hydrolase [Halonatronomonas betaini]